MKKWIYIIPAIIIILFGCSYKSWKGKRPCDQPNTIWEAWDNSIEFNIDENGAGTGELLFNNGSLDVHIAIGPATQIYIYPLECVDGDYVDGQYIEYWTAEYIKPNMFIATVKETTYFSVGMKIEIYRMDNAN